MTITATVLSLGLGAAFLAAGVPKARRTAHYRARARHWRLPERALRVIGLVELSAAVLLVAGGIGQSRAGAAAGAGLVVATMLGAVSTHRRIGDPARAAAPALALGTLAAVDLLAVL